MYLPTQSPQAPSPPRVTPSAVPTAAAAHLTTDVRRRLRVELHAQQHFHQHQHQHQQNYHHRVSVSSRHLREYYSGERTAGASHSSSHSSSARKVAAVAAIQKELTRIDAGASGAPSAAGGPSSSKTTGSSSSSSSSSSSHMVGRAPPSSSSAAGPSTALPLTIGMGMLRTSSAGSLPTLLRAGKRQLPSASASSTSASTTSGSSDKEALDSTRPKLHTQPSFTRQELDDAPAPGLGVGIYAAPSTAALGGAAGGGRRNRSCSDLGSVLFPTQPVAHHQPIQVPAAPKPSRFAGLTSTLQTLIAPPRTHYPTAGKRCGAGTAKGRKPGRPLWENQDSFVFVEADGGVGQQGGLVGMFAVMDGHGDAGHKVSRHCRERLPHVMAQVNHDPHLAYPLLQEELKAAFGPNLDSSGCTCVLALLRRPTTAATSDTPLRLTVANLGDSRCVLGRRRRSHDGMIEGEDEGGEGEDGTIVAVALSDDHKPDRHDELQRIVAAGGRVGCRQYYVSGDGAGHGRSASMPQFAVQLGPPRLWYPVPGGGQGEYTGLAMSRSLGDVAAHSAGGSCEPEVVEVDVKPGDEFLVLATDGLWDVVGNQLAVELVDACRARARREGREWEAKEAAGVLVQFARQRWEGLSSDMIDDITCMVVRLR